MDDSNLRRTYLGMVSHMDDIVDNVTDTLREVGMYENAILLVMSDNGAYSDSWEASEFPGSGSNYPLRGQKGDYFEGGTRVPAFVHSPLLRETG